MNTDAMLEWWLTDIYAKDLNTDCHFDSPKVLTTSATVRPQRGLPKVLTTSATDFRTKPLINTDDRQAQHAFLFDRQMIVSTKIHWCSP